VDHRSAPEPIFRNPTARRASGAVRLTESVRCCTDRSPAGDPHTPSKGTRSVTDGPLIVQSDKTLLLEVDHPMADDARAAIAPFAELERAPEHVHTYRVTPLALWNARAAGHDAEQVVDALVRFSRYAVPQPLLVDVVDTMGRYGRLQLANHPAHGLVMTALDRAVLEEVMRQKKIAPMLGARIDQDSVIVHPSERGHLKQMLLKVGWPAEDLAGYVDGEAHAIDLVQDGWTLRDYQAQAVEGFWQGGSGVVVLPCGAGKTLVGAAAMAKAKATTLILVTNTVSGRQWKRELIARTSLTEEEIGEYSGEKKEIRPVTIATYQVITRKTKGEYRHLELFDSRDWGLVLYDEVHLLPAPVFRMTADLQSRRRLGLTATLVREDGREGDVFSLIGPKRFDAPWRDIEQQGWIAPAECTEVRVTMTEAERLAYATAEAEERYRMASTARTKLPVVQAILDRHKGEPTLVIGAYLDQLDDLGEALDCPVIQGSTKNRERESLFEAFRMGEIDRLVVSKVANFSIDLPEASIAVQVSGTFGSRQEEAQRLGRLLRPKGDGRQAHFYSVVSRDTLDTEYAAHRQRFLAEQGYAYRIVDADDLLGPALPEMDPETG
jgi:DNA excision repair protein ERCC-3